MADYDTADIRKFITDCFSDEELTTFCFDYFRDAYEEFAAGMSKTEKVQRLIEGCVRREALPNLLTAAWAGSGKARLKNASDQNTRSAWRDPQP